MTTSKEWFLSLRQVHWRVVLLALILAIVRYLFPERALETIGFQAWLDNGFALGLWAFVLLLGGGVGWKILRWLKIEDLTGLEQAVFSFAVGLGVIAYGVLALGLIGLLQPWAITSWLIILAIFSWPEWNEVISLIPSWIRRWKEAWNHLTIGNKLFFITGFIMLLLAFMTALTPTWDYDGLMYHLEAPRKFLAAGRIIPLPDIWGGNGPFTVEMLFTIGLSFGSDPYAKLIHLFYALLFVAGTYTIGQRYLNSTGGWIASAILFSVPIFSVWACLAYADMGWATYEFLGLYAFLLWVDKRRDSLLVLSGIMTGLSLGCKYLALNGLLVLGVAFLWQWHLMGWKTTLVKGAVFGFIALAIGSPWYLKNWLWTGNPVYPLYFGGLAWPQERVDWLMMYLNSFGVGHSVRDYLMLPLNIYSKHVKFATFMGTIEIPSFLFPFSIIYLLMKKVRIINFICILAFIRFALWALGSQQIRFLLPIFPWLSLLTAYVFSWNVITLHPRYVNILRKGLVGGVVAGGFLIAVLFWLKINPLPVISGSESKDTFLRRVVADYSVLQYIQNSLSPNERVFMMWDGQGYYCDERCFPDAEHDRWVRMVSQNRDITAITQHLHEQGISHILFSLESANFILLHDPSGQHYEAARFFIFKFQPVCAQEVYRDELMILYELTC